MAPLPTYTVAKFKPGKGIYYKKGSQQNFDIINENLCLKYVLAPPLAICTYFTAYKDDGNGLRNETQHYFLTEKCDMVPTVGLSINQFSSSAPYLRKVMYNFDRRKK
jgi:hypothetical protein